MHTMEVFKHNKFLTIILMKIEQFFWVSCKLILFWYIGAFSPGLNLTQFFKTYITGSDIKYCKGFLTVFHAQDVFYRFLKG